MDFHTGEGEQKFRDTGAKRGKFWGKTGGEARTTRGKNEGERPGRPKKKGLTDHQRGYREKRAKNSSSKQTVGFRSKRGTTAKCGRKQKPGVEIKKREETKHGRETKLSKSLEGVDVGDREGGGRGAHLKKSLRKGNEWSVRTGSQ